MGTAQPALRVKLPVQFSASLNVKIERRPSARAHAFFAAAYTTRERERERERECEVREKRARRVAENFSILLSQHKYQAGSEKKFPPPCGDSLEKYLYMVQSASLRESYFIAQRREGGAGGEKKDKRNE